MSFNNINLVVILNITRPKISFSSGITSTPEPIVPPINFIFEHNFSGLNPLNDKTANQNNYEVQNNFIFEHNYSGTNPLLDKTVNQNNYEIHVDGTLPPMIFEHNYSQATSNTAIYDPIYPDGGLMIRNTLDINNEYWVSQPSSLDWSNIPGQILI